MHAEFLELIELNKGIIYKVYNKYSAFIKFPQEDVIQEVLLNAWKSFSSFSKKSKFSTWLYSVARFVCVDIIRKTVNTLWDNAIPVYSYKEDERPVYYEPSITDVEVKVQQALVYDTVLDSLPKRDHDMLFMFFEGVSYSEISKHFSITENYARVTISRIKKRLRLRYG